MLGVGVGVVWGSYNHHGIHEEMLVCLLLYLALIRTNEAGW